MRLQQQQRPRPLIQPLPRVAARTSRVSQITVPWWAIHYAVDKVVYYKTRNTIAPQARPIAKATNVDPRGVSV